MTEIIVSAHAAQRYIERVDPAMSAMQAIAAIMQSERAIRAAALFGCGTVKRADGTRLVLDGLTVITVVCPCRFGVLPRKAVEVSR